MWKSFKDGFTEESKAEEGKKQEKEELNSLDLPISSYVDPEQVKILRELYEKTGMDIKEVFENYKIDNLYKLTQKEYEKLKKRLEDILKEQEKEQEAKDKAQFAEFLENVEKGDNKFQNFWGDNLIILDNRVELIIKEGSPTLEKDEFGNSRYDIGKTRIHYEGLKLSFSKKHKWIEFGHHNSWGKGNIRFKNLAKWEHIEEIIYEAKKNYGKNPIQQTVIHGDYVDDRDTTYVDDRDTIVKDSVVNKSNIGAGGKSKAEELREAKALLDEGVIDDNEFKQMKKEILNG